MSLTVVKDATCTFCGCVCDDIELHADGDRIVKAKNACSLGESWFKHHTAERSYPDALIDGKPATLDDAIEAAAELLVCRQHAVGVRTEQHHVRGTARSRRARLSSSEVWLTATLPFDTAPLR